MNIEEFQVTDNVDIGLLYEFCLDWQMNSIDKEVLKMYFKESGWDFTVFKSTAKYFNWFVGSMEVLND